jgi:hypothetical protein
MVLDLANMSWHDRDMGPWASVIVGIAALLAVFFAVMGFRGLMDAIEHHSAECGACHRTTLLPLPLGSQQCWRCHYGRSRSLSASRLMIVLTHRHRA